MIDNTAVMSSDSVKTLPSVVHGKLFLLCHFDQVIFGKSSCGEFMKEAVTPVIYHNK